MDFKYFNMGDSKEELKKQYKKLAIKYHPDVNKNGDDNIMKEINSEYDKILKYKDNSSNFGFNISGNVYGGSMIKDIFSQMFDSGNFENIIRGSNFGFGGFNFDNFGFNSRIRRKADNLTISFKTKMSYDKLKKEISEMKNKVIKNSASKSSNFRVFIKRTKNLFKESEYIIRASGTDMECHIFRKYLENI